MSEELVLYEVDRGVATLTLNRPARRNALSPELMAALHDALGRAKADADARAIVITGAGDRAFCAGGDLGSGFAGGGVLAQRAQRALFGRLFTALHGLGKPAVAALNGDALGGGFGLAVGCDLVIADEGARVGTPEIALGLFPMVIMAELMRNIPRKILLEMMFTGRKLQATEAAGFHVINRIAPAGAALAEAQELAAGIAARSPAVLKLGKDAFYRTAEMRLEPSLDYLLGQLELNLMTEDAAEGITAFLQRRPPEWKGR